MATSRRFNTRHIIAITLLLAHNCLAARAINLKLHVSGFPDSRITPFEGNGWPGTARCFNGNDGKLYYVEIMFDRSYDRYCTALLESAGINECSIEMGSLMYEREGNRRAGFQPDPDRIAVNFQLHYKARPSQRNVSFTYILPPSSKALGHTAGFNKLTPDKRSVLCVESVTADMKSIADQLVSRLKNGPIEVGSLAIPYNPSAPRHERSDNDYKIGFVNKTGENLFDLSLSYGEQDACTVPDVVRQVNVNYSEFLSLKWPAQATVRWKQGVGLPWNESVKAHSATVRLDGVVPPGFSKGTIFIVIRNHNSVEVRAIKSTDSEASVSLMREK